MGRKADKGPRLAPAEGAGEGADLPERWSAQRKTELVMRLLRGKALDGVSRDSQVPGHELEGWKQREIRQLAGGLRRPHHRHRDPGPHLHHVITLNTRSNS